MRSTRLLTGVVIVAAVLCVWVQAQEPQTPPERAAGVKWAPGDLIQPEELAARLRTAGPATAAGRAHPQNSKDEKPVIIYVGFPVLYRNGHVPGALLAGPASKPPGLEALKTAASKLSRDREIVVYCGCCPWDKCPNIAPAFRALKQLGFKRIRVMMIPTDFGKDWKERGFPVEGKASNE